METRTPKGTRKQTNTKHRGEGRTREDKVEEGADEGEGTGTRMNSKGRR